jgi:hypothetical protein
MRILWLLVLVAAYAGSAEAAGPEIAGCPMFPPNNVWNTPVDTLPVSPSSAKHIATIGAARPLHPDFGEDLRTGIPFNIVGPDAKKIKIPFQYESESEPGPYPVPAGVKVEGGAGATGDRHVLIVDPKTCVLYELFEMVPQGVGPASGWKAGSGSIFNLRSNELRPEGWTSADAAGLPILPGLLRYDEVKAGEIAHAIRFTVSKTKSEHIWPARHDASRLQGAEYMPMGARLRLKASVDISRFSPSNQLILRALKKYGMILADTGSDWYLSGVSDSRWSDSDLHNLKSLTGADFEEVDTLPLRVSENSGEARVLNTKAPIK